MLSVLPGQRVAQRSGVVGPIELVMPEVRRPSGTDARARAAPRIIYVATEDWYLLQRCLGRARAGRAAGFEVHVAANVTEDAATIRGEGFILHAMRFGRGRLSQLRTLRTISTLRHLYRLVDPAIVHHVAMEPALVGIVASFGSAFAAVYAIAGLQPPSPAAKRRSLRPGRRLLLRLGLKRRRAAGLVQTPDDREALARLGVKPERIALIPGAGIDADRLRPIPEPDGQVTVAFAGQMAVDNGVRTLIEAQRRANCRDASRRMMTIIRLANP